MTYCTTCGHPIHPTVRQCPQCGALPRRPSAPAPLQGSEPLALPVAALVCGLLAPTALLVPAPWSVWHTLAAAALMAAAVVLGCMAVARQERGQVLAMAGAALGTAAVMGAMLLHLR